MLPSQVQRDQQQGTHRDRSCSGYQPLNTRLTVGGLRLLDAQKLNLIEDVLLHTVGEYQRGKAGIQGANDGVIHCPDTILSTEIPGAFVPDAGG